MTTTLDRHARNFEAARRCVHKLDRNACLAPEDKIPPTQVTVDELLNNLASWCSEILGLHYGAGSWHASHMLRTLELPTLTGILIVLGASPFLIEQHSEGLLTRIHGLSHRAGVL